MAVEVNSERKGVEISWNTLVEGAPPEPGEKPPDFPSYPDARPEHPIYLPPYIWGPTDPRPTPPIEIPPDIGLDEEQKEKLRAFLEGNLPPFTPPDYPAPVSGEKGGKVKAVQIFGLGQDGDWSNTAIMPNDGLAFLSYPKSFTGDSYIEVREAFTGTLVDSGVITVE